MIQDFKIIHRRKPHVFTAAEFPVWSTCLRSLAFAPADVVAGPGDEVFNQREAYRFLLEVICGLKSPIVGETEVFGQFKVFSQDWIQAQPKQASLVQRLLNDAKAIRTQYLSHLGIQSYGSWVRKNLRAEKVHILGAGHLAQEILPYLLKQNIEVVIHARDLSKVDFFSGQKNVLRAGGFDHGAVIVAAPLSAQQIQEFVGTANVQQVFDLRDTSRTDPPGLKTALFGLHEIFAQIEKTKALLVPRLKLVHEEIALRSAKAFDHVLVRPQGWDDLCA